MPVGVFLFPSVPLTASCNLSLKKQKGEVRVGETKRGVCHDPHIEILWLTDTWTGAAGDTETRSQGEQKQAGESFKSVLSLEKF